MNANLLQMKPANNSPRTCKIASIPMWTHGDDASIFSFVSAIALSGLEEQWIRVSVGDQRKLLGFPVFGRKAIKIIGKDSSVSIYKTQAFGQDGEKVTFQPSRVTELVKEKTVFNF